jgi:outer membrane protein
MRKLFFVLFLSFIAVTLGFSVSMAAWGQRNAPEATKVGIFDMQRIIVESKSGKEARTKFESELAERRDILMGKEDQLRRSQQELLESDLDSAEKREKERELAQDAKELRRLKTDLEEEMRNMDQELTIKLLKDVVKIVRDIGEKENYNLILQKSGNMVYIDSAIDLTDQVLKKYDVQAR